MRLRSAFQGKIFKDYGAEKNIRKQNCTAILSSITRYRQSIRGLSDRKKSKGPRRRYRTVYHGNGYSRWIIRQYSEWLIALKAGYSALNTTKTNNCTAVELYFAGVSG